ncbi:MAG: 4Fe-4S binding protein [Chromatiales bacterium]
MQITRAWTQTAFFLLFLLAPVLDIFRLDLNLGHFILFGHAWTLDLADFQRGNMSSLQAVGNLFLYVFVPLLVLVAGFILVARRWGRLYCGWLCPHFSVVEVVNRLMFRASGKPDLWEAKPLPALQADGTQVHADKRYWLVTIPLIVFFAFTWAVGLLTYLLPPAEIYSNLVSASLTRNQFIFIAVATGLFSIEFTFARHLFCRYACAVGFFQSLAWMSNRKAMVVSFDAPRGGLCQSCNNACDNQCPMRLQPRIIKRKMFNCTQCGECIAACRQKQGDDNTLLKWVSGDLASKLSDPPVEITVKRDER